MCFKFVNVWILPCIVIKDDNLRSLTIPQYTGLNIDTILGHVDGNQDVHRYLPEKEELKKCPKQWLVNVIYTVIKII